MERSYRFYPNTFAGVYRPRSEPPPPSSSSSSRRSSESSTSSSSTTSSGSPGPLPESPQGPSPDAQPSQDEQPTYRIFRRLSSLTSTDSDSNPDLSTLDLGPPAIKPFKRCRCLTITYQENNATNVFPVLRTTHEDIVRYQTWDDFFVFNVHDFRDASRIPSSDAIDGKEHSNTALLASLPFAKPGGISRLQTTIIIIWLHEKQSIEDHTLLAVMQHEFSADLRRAQTQPRTFDNLHLNTFPSDIATMVLLQKRGHMTAQRFPEVEIPAWGAMGSSAADGVARPDFRMGPKDGKKVGTRPTKACSGCERMFEWPTALGRHEAVCERVLWG